MKTGSIVGRRKNTVSRSGRTGCIVKERELATGARELAAKNNKERTGCIVSRGERTGCIVSRGERTGCIVSRGERTGCIVN